MGRRNRTWALVAAALVAAVLLGAGLALWPSAVPAPPFPSPTALPPAPTKAQLSATQVPTPGPLPTASPTQLAAPSPTAPLPAPSPTVGSFPTRNPGPPPVLTRGPYLQSVTPTSVLVVWETEGPSAGEVRYGEEGGALPGWILDPVLGTHHVVTLTGLAPYTRYSYRVESDGAPLSAEFAFRTAAAPGEGAFTFVAFGDTRTRHDVHRAVIAQIGRLKPDFVLHTGDLVEHGGSTREWDTFFEIEAPLLARAPLFPVLGNHEGNDPRYFAAFYLPGNERWYAFDYGSVRFICLQVDGIARLDATSEQYAWLEEALARNTQPWLFVFFHVPPFSALKEEQQEIAVRETLTPLFERSGVDLVFNGHHHNYQRAVVRGVTYIVTGGGGAPIYPVEQPDETTVAFANEPHVVLVSVTQREVSGVALSAEGEELDRFVLTRD